MATITGSTTIDWSGVVLTPIDLQQQLDEFSARFDEALTEFENDTVHFLSPPTSTSISVRLSTGAVVNIRGSGFGTDDPVITSFAYSNPFTHDIVRFTGAINIHFDNNMGTINSFTIGSMTIGVPGFQATVIGNIVVDPVSGEASGSISQLKETIGSTTVTIKGNLSLSVSDEISGTITDISVLSGTNTIVMSGLSVDYSALDSVTTANDLFSAVSNQLTGDDTITYTNNSGVGMTFFGGAGHDTITINGPNGDILNGGDGNDILTGGPGQDIVNGESGDDRITMLVTAGNTDIIDAGADNDTLVLSGVVPGNHEVVVDLSSPTDQVVSIGGVANALTQINFENLNASGIGSSVTVTGSNADNNIIGSNGHDTLSGGAGQDTVDGGVGNDIVVMQVTAGNVDSADGGVGTDTLALVGAVDGDGVVVVDLSAVTDQVTRIGTVDPESLVQKNFENLDASGLGSSVNATGSAGANLLIGSNGADTLNGGAGNDTLNGGAGDDTLNGGIGNDVILVGNAAEHGEGEVIDGGAGMDVLRFTSITDNETLALNATVTGVESVVIANAAGLTTGTTALNVDASNVLTELILTGNAGDNVLTGTSANDILNGGAGNDTLNGGDGINTLLGGTGNDTYIVDASPNLVIEGLNAGTDTVVASRNYILTANVENLELTGTALTGTGNALANTITGTSGADTLFGFAGHDTLSGGAGQDTVDGGVGNDIVVMQVTAGNVDSADGGVGTDTLALVGAVDGDGVVVVDLSAVTDQVTRIGTVDPESLVQKNFENLDASGLGSSVNATGSAGANLLIGSNGADTLNGGAGNDTLNGGAGDDTLNGGIGNDVILVGNAAEHGEGEVIDGGAGMDVLRFTSITDNETLALNATVTGVESVVIANAAGLTTGTTALNVDASNVLTELILTGNAGDNVLTGTSANDILNGGAGNDTLNGGDGINTLLGGTGNDTYIVDASPNLVIEGLNAGTDTVVASRNYILTANVENLELTGTALTGTGNALANTITGTSGADTLFGFAGHDTLSGGAGQDTVDGGVGNDIVVMQVTAGNVDSADGGVGTDTLALVGAVDGDGVVVVDLSAVTDQVTRIGTVDPESLVQKNFENLDASGLGSSVNATGSAGANLLIGSNGADTLNGGAGNDTLNGGAGDDTLNGGIGNDVILVGNAAEHGEGEVIDGGAGMDVLRFTSITDNETLALNATVTGVESVVIANAAGLTTGTTALNVDASNVLTELILTGNAGDNVLTGTSANDILNGGAGNDTLNGGDGINTLLGGTGNDTYIVDASPNLVIEGLNAGTDTVVASRNYILTANVENLELTGTALTGTGNALANTITGTSGADTLFGFAGHDTLSGGAGQDTVDGGVGNDIVVMQVTAGNVDSADGGVGTDTLALVGAVDGDGVVVVDLSAVTDQVTRIGTVDPESLVQKNFENLDASGLGSSVNATGSAGANLLIGSNGADTLNGGAGNDTLNGGAGDDTLNGGIGNDTFLFSLGDGQDLIQDSSGTADKMLFNGGINPLDLVISRQANDLRIAIHGTSDQITVENWYASAVNRTETIQASNGQTLLSSKVDQLIQAMAGFTQQTSLTWDQAIDQQAAQVETILAASWQ